jgi:chemotaxis protein CheD
MAARTKAAPRPRASGVPGEAQTFYFDREFDRHVVKILPGEFFVAQDDVVLSTVLGSCVAACIWDRVAGIGGMNHFMLPEGGSASDPAGLAGRYGVFAMEQLINELIRRGARKANFEAKVFGGGHVMRNFTVRVGQRNADFVLSFLRTEGIPVAARDLLDVHPRRVAFFAASGRVLCKRLAQPDPALVAAERQYTARLATDPVAGEIRLF